MMFLNYLGWVVMVRTLHPSSLRHRQVPCHHRSIQRRTDRGPVAVGDIKTLAVFSIHNYLGLKSVSIFSRKAILSKLFHSFIRKYRKEIPGVGNLIQPNLIQPPSKHEILWESLTHCETLKNRKALNPSIYWVRWQVS